jgi:hypothetical protein
MKLNSRNIHRDLGYFYVGLIIAFALSGIFLNHRQNWHPEKYTTEVKAITFQVPQDEKAITDEFVEGMTKQLGIAGKHRRFMVRKGELRVAYEKFDVEIDIKTGQGELISFIKTPVVGQIIQLHKDTSAWWIYYSDVFGLSMIIIAVTGMFIGSGKFSFRARGWKLALAGLVFPLIFLFLLS